MRTPGSTERSRVTPDHLPEMTPASAGVRSPLLQALPRADTTGRRERIAQRMIKWSLLLGGGLWVFTTIRTKGFGAGAVARLLYLAHDTIFLPLKGYTFTRFYPFSLIWYGVALTLFALWLGCHVRDRSLVRRAHLWLLRHAVNIPLANRLLILVARPLARWGFPPDHLLLVLEHERDRVMTNVAQSAAVTGLQPRLRVLTILQIRLQLLYGGRLATLQAAVTWLDAWLILRWRGRQESEKLATSRELQLIVERMLRVSSPASSTPSSSADALLSIPATAMQLLNLAGLSQRRRHGDADPLQALIHAAERRRETIDQLRGYLELLLFEQARRSTIADGVLKQIAPEATLDELPLLGALQLRCALAAAVEARLPDLALGSIEAVEALNIVLGSVLAYDEHDLPLGRARRWMAKVPAPLDYLVAASLASDATNRRRRVWETHLEQPNSILRQADADLAVARTAELVLAAGDMYPNSLFEDGNERA